MSLRLVSVVLVGVAAVALAQDGEAPQVVPGYSSPRVDFGIVVSDVGKAKAFYGDALGLKEARQFTIPAEFGKAAGLTDGLPFTVHVMQLGNGPDATNVKLMAFDGVRPRRPDNSFLHSSYGVRYLTFYVDDLPAALERAAKHGVKPVTGEAQRVPEAIAPGMGLALLRDPDGNAVELVGAMK